MYDDHEAKFMADGETIATIPYKGIASLEYGQKAGRRIAVAVTLTWMALFSKKRKHYLTVGWKDSDGKNQGVILDMGKEVARLIVGMMKVKSGVDVEYESLDAQDDLSR